MAYLINSNIFLRAAKRNDPDRQLALDAISKLRANKEDLYYTTQGLSSSGTFAHGPRTRAAGLDFLCK